MLSCATAITDDVIMWSITSRWCQAVIMSNCHYWWCHPVSLSLLMMLCCDIDLSDVILCNCHYWWCHPVRYHIMIMSNCHHAKRWNVDAEMIISATFSTEMSMFQCWREDDGHGHQHFNTRVNGNFAVPAHYGPRVEADTCLSQTDHSETKPIVKILLGVRTGWYLQWHC